jgi:hypothetical protein
MPAPLVICITLNPIARPRRTGSIGTETRLKSLSGKFTRKKMSQIKQTFPDRLSVSEMAA